jgi:ribonucleoside-diphosphate reductase alpha chain
MDNILTNGKLVDMDKRLAKYKQVAIDTNKRYADKFGIQPSTAITCVKPSGTVSQLCDSASGIHARHSQYYVRTVRGDNKDPLTKFMVGQGVPSEPCVMKPDTTTVFSFPMQSPKGSRLRDDMSALEQLRVWMIYQEYWCEHKPSITVTVREDEWFDVGAFVFKHFDKMSGVSFLPHSDHVYQQAPYQECTEDEYHDMITKTTTRIDWSKLKDYEVSDTTSGSQTMACSGDSCEIVDIGA